MNYLVSILISFYFVSAWSACPQFETALESAMARVTSKGPIEKAASLSWASPRALNYKVKYGIESVNDTANRTFMTLMEADKQKLVPRKVMYFDVENAVQKKLNDSLIGDKTMVDSVNNSFMGKFQQNIKNSPELMARIEGQYKDYKSLRLRLTLREGDNPLELEARLSEIYQRTNREFTAEFEREGLTKLLPPRTDEVPDVSTWFLSGSGESALEANMAARGARNSGFAMGNAKTVGFKQQVESMHADMAGIEGMRNSLASDPRLVKSKIMEATREGAVIPSKEMIGVLRKIKPSDCENATEYAAKIRAKVKTLFKFDISDKHIDELTTYFQKVDSISPPLYQRERVVINLGDAKSGIISVDFTGVGVDNAYEQMRALSTVNYAQKDKAVLLKEAFQKVQTNVDNVTTDMNRAKRTFTVAARNPADPGLAPQFSGDDGILMPKKNWSQHEKTNLLKLLSKTEDPSKYRVTFVKTEFDSGVIVPVAERSQRVVRAEGIEKAVREAVIGMDKIPGDKAKKMIFAIDSIPATTGGKFNLIIGGLKPTDEEKKLILDAFKKSLLLKEGEISGEIIEAFN